MHTSIVCAFLSLQIGGAALSLAQPASPENAPDFSRVRSRILDQVQRSTIPSIAIAVVRNGKIIWEEGFGWANREKHLAANERTVYYAASVTKTFTATALMILQDRKQLDLDRPINDYLGSAKLWSPAWNPAGATIRRVETHTAGLTTFNPTTPLSIEETIRRFGVLFWPPGERFDYSNLGPLILEDVVARLSKRSYADFLREEIFLPMGMTRASYGLAPQLEPEAAQRYSSSGGLRPPSAGGSIAARTIWRCSPCSI